MPIDIDLTGSTVLVTGGARGVGAGITTQFLRAGATVVVCGRSTAQPPEGAEFLACDVRDPAAVGALFETITARHGRLDVLVNNAGGSPYADTATASPRFAAKVVELNLLAPLQLAQQANILMREQDSGGVVLNICSVSGARPSPRTAAYGAAKAGLANLTTTLAVEWAPKVRVNALEVGIVRTELSATHFGGAEGIAAVAATVPLGRLADPVDIGGCAVFLASPLAAYVSGAVLRVDGGGERPAFLDASKGEST